MATTTQDKRVTPGTWSRSSSLALDAIGLCATSNSGLATLLLERLGRIATSEKAVLPGSKGSLGKQIRKCPHPYRVHDGCFGPL